jgi:poly(A) polymerase
MRETWTMQPRFDKRTGSAPWSLIEQPRFRAAFDFMRLRADCGEVDEALAEWWQEFSQASDERREDLLEQAREESGRARVRVVKGAKRESDAPQEAALPQGDEFATAPKKRRRRRKPVGERATAAPAPDSGA